MFTSIAVAFATFIFIQWPTIFTIYFLSLVAMLLVNLVHMDIKGGQLKSCLLGPHESSELIGEQKLRGLSSEEETKTAIRTELAAISKRFKRNLKIIAFAAIIGIIAPNQKTLGVVVGVGVATYAVQQTLDDPTVRKFFALVRKVADNELDERLKAIPTK